MTGFFEPGKLPASWLSAMHLPSPPAPAPARSADASPASPLLALYASLDGARDRLLDHMQTKEGADFDKNDVADIVADPFFCVLKLVGGSSGPRSLFVTLLHPHGRTASAALRDAQKRLHAFEERTAAMFLDLAARVEALAPADPERRRLLDICKRELPVMERLMDTALARLQLLLRDVASASPDAIRAAETFFDLENQHGILLGILGR